MRFLLTLPTFPGIFKKNAGVLPRSTPAGGRNIVHPNFYLSEKCGEGFRPCKDLSHERENGSGGTTEKKECRDGRSPLPRLPPPQPPAPSMPPPRPESAAGSLTLRHCRHAEKEWQKASSRIVFLHAHAATGSL